MQATVKDLSGGLPGAAFVDGGGERSKNKRKRLQNEFKKNWPDLSIMKLFIMY